MGAVRLLETARRPIDADPAWDESVRPSSLPKRVPQLQAMFDGHVKLPTQVADVRDARCEHSKGADLDLPARAELEPLVGDVVSRHRGKDVARARTPQPDCGEGCADVMPATWALPSCGR